MILLLVGLVLVIAIGNAFYRLAESHGRSKWTFAILGVVSYFVSSFTFGIISVLMLDVFAPMTSALQNLPLIYLLQIPIGLLCCYILYRILRHQWRKSSRHSDNNLLDSDLRE